MNTDTIKAENKAFTVKTIRNALRMKNTLSGALRIAGIKETKSASSLKGNKKSKNSKKKRLNKKKKNAFNNYFSEEYMSDGFLRPKKLRKPLKQYVPHKPRNTKKNKIKGSPEPPQNDMEIMDEKTIFVSLDFIEDCQNYKKKVRKTKGSSLAMREEKSNARSLNSSQEGLEKKQSQKSTLDVKSQWGNLEKGKVSMSREKKSENDLKETKSKLGKNVLESDDIAKIDKIYLEKLLSLATKQDDKKISSDGESETSESPLEKKKVLSGKYFFDKKMRLKELQSNFSKNVQDSSSANVRPKNNSGFQAAAVASPRVVRGKSEEQILLKKGKNLFETQDNVKQKSETYSRADIVEIGRKARKPRNKFMKSNFKQIVDPSLPREVSKVADVKELWRRNALLNKSDNSLTSLSSCTAPELDEYFESRDLDSYRILKKLVEDEISKIMKKSENKYNAKDETKETDPKHENQEPEDGKNTKDSPPPLPISMDPEKLNALPIFKRRLLQAECESQLQKAQMLSFLTQDIPKEANLRLEQLEEKEKGGKIPSKVIENWNILHRLEQAFVGLGTPTFPDKNSKISPNIKPKSSITKGDINAALEKTRADRAKEVKRVQQLPRKREKKGSGNQISSHQKLKTRNPLRSVKKALSCDNRPQEQQRGAKKLGKTTRQDHPQTSLATAPKREEVKKKKSKNPPNALLPKTSSRNPPELASRNAKKELGSPNPNLFTPSKARLVYIRSKLQKLTKKKSSHAVSMNSNQKKKSEENLERKKTFNVISVTDASIDRLHKSNSLNDVNLKGEKNSQTKNQDKTPSDIVSDEVKEEQKLKSKTIESDAIAKGKSSIPKRLAKYQPTAVHSEQTSEEHKIDEKILYRIKNLAKKLRHSGEKKPSTLSGTDETKTSGEKDCPNLKTPNERASSNRAGVREKTPSNLKTVGEKDCPNPKTAGEKESSKHTGVDEKDSQKIRIVYEKESSTPKKGSHQQESSEVEIVYEKELRKPTTDDEKELRKPTTDDEKDSPSSKTAGEKVSPNLKTIDEKALPNFLTVNEKNSSLKTVDEKISSIKVADEKASSENCSTILKMVDEMISPSPKITGENYSSNLKLIDEMVSPSPTTTVEKDSSKSKIVEEKNAALKTVGEKIFPSTKVDDEKMCEKGSSSLKMVDEMISPSPMVTDEKDSSNPKTADENESLSLKKAGEKHSSILNITDEKNSSKTKVVDEKNPLKPMVVGEKRSSHINILDQKDSKHVIPDEKVSSIPKVDVEKGSSNPNLVDERLPTELNVLDRNDTLSFQIVSEKLCSKESVIQLMKGSVLPFEDTVKESIVKELSNRAVKVQQTEYKSNDSVTIKIDENNSNCNTHISDTNANAIRERAVKKRSFLSVHVNQTCDQPPRVLVQIKEKDDSDAGIGKHIFTCSANKASESDFSQVSTLTYNLNDLNICTYFNGRSSQPPSFRPPTDFSTRLSMSMSKNSVSLDENYEQEENSSEPSKKQLWEKDLTHYRSIVRDIMNQYKRIDGFLKQNEHLIDAPNEVSSEEVNNSEEGSLNSQMNIKEYRKKIISEYKELPVLEYRTKQLQSGSSFSSNSRRTSLLVAKEVKKDADLDVKDYVPNIQKVLDSQLYVDMESMVKRNEASAHPKQKKSSLQDIKREKRTDSNENGQKGSSSSKAFQAWINNTNYLGAQALSCDQITESATNDSYSDSDFS